MGGYQERAFKSDDEAESAILRAVRASGGSIIKAAEILGISYRSMSRYISRLGLKAEISRISGARGADVGGTNLAGSKPGTDFASRRPKRG